jgi:hypothetical protein
VVDEAGDSAPWVPRVGLGLLVALVAAIVLANWIGHEATEPVPDAATAEPGAGPRPD